MHPASVRGPKLVPYMESDLPLRDKSGIVAGAGTALSIITERQPFVSCVGWTVYPRGPRCTGATCAVRATQITLLAFARRPRGTGFHRGDACTNRRSSCACDPRNRMACYTAGTDAGRRWGAGRPVRRVRECVRECGPAAACSTAFVHRAPIDPPASGAAPLHCREKRGFLFGSPGRSVGSHTQRPIELSLPLGAISMSRYGAALQTGSFTGAVPVPAS